MPCRPFLIRHARIFLYGVFADGNRWELDIKRSEPDVVLMDIEMPGSEWH